MYIHISDRFSLTLLLSSATTRYSLIFSLSLPLPPILSLSLSIPLPPCTYCCVLKWIEFIIMMRLVRAKRKRGRERERKNPRSVKLPQLNNPKKLCFFDCTWFILTVWNEFKREKSVGRRGDQEKGRIANENLIGWYCWILSMYVVARQLRKSWCYRQRMGNGKLSMEPTPRYLHSLGTNANQIPKPKSRKSAFWIYT